MIDNCFGVNIIKGGSFSDSRGTVRFVNDFHFDGIRRFYSIQHPDIKVIRAWQGHKFETKFFFVSCGAFKISWVKVDNWQNPSKDLDVNSKVLSDSESNVLMVSPGHATAIKALSPNSILIVFADKSLEESKADDYRFEVDYWMFEH